MLEDGEPNDPAVFVTARSPTGPSATILIGDGERLSIVAIETDIDEELIDAGFNGVFVVEPVY